MPCQVVPVRIDVIIPAYNVAPYIGDAIRSVLAQPVPGWRIVVVDDGSTDETVAEVRRFADTRIRLIRQVNAGVSAARNAGIEAGVSDAVLFLDADDWLGPDALAALSAALAAAPDAVAAVGPYARVRPGGRVALLSRFRPSAGMLARLLVRNEFPNGGHLLIRRRAVAAAGGFRTDLRYGEDWEYWVRLALQGRFVAAPAPTPVCFIRERGNGAYGQMAADQTRFATCLDAIHANSNVIAATGAERLAALRRLAEAENHWVTGRELIRHGHVAEGRGWLRRSIRLRPSPRRLLLLAGAAGLGCIPDRWRGPFTPYMAG
jgi:glycosyltransferase involved in cell wall biosynthesis